jgi:hypothetical protein
LWLTTGATFKCHFVLGVLKFPKLGFLVLWRAITSYENLWLKWGLNQSCSPSWKLSNDMWHATYTRVFQGKYSGWCQIDTLTLDLSFGHNLCFKYSNGSYNPILNIYVSRVFQWYNELFNPMKFDPWNTFLKIHKSIGIPIPKMGIHLGVCEFIPSHSPTLPGVCEFIPSHSPTLPGVWNVTLGFLFQPAPLQALTLVVSPRLGLKQLPYQQLPFQIGKVNL